MPNLVISIMKIMNMHAFVLAARYHSEKQLDNGPSRLPQSFNHYRISIRKRYVSIIRQTLEM